VRTVLGALAIDMDSARSGTFNFKAAEVSETADAAVSLAYQREDRACSFAGCSTRSRRRDEGEPPSARTRK